MAAIRVFMMWRAAPAVLLLATGSGCTSYGANFDYPPEAPAPRSVSVVATGTGEDDDDPIRSRQQVVDLRGSSLSALLDFYREDYPSSQGWKTVQGERDQELCLVNGSQSDYTGVLEVFPYTGSRVLKQPDRHLVVISRIADASRRPCGVAFGWIPMDLF